jgi:AraC-like DNA-binding protein
MANFSDPRRREPHRAARFGGRRGAPPCGADVTSVSCKPSASWKTALRPAATLGAERKPQAGNENMGHWTRARAGSGGIDDPPASGCLETTPLGRASSRRARGVGRSRQACVPPGSATRAAAAGAAGNDDRPRGLDRHGARIAAPAVPLARASGAGAAGPESGAEDGSPTGGALAPWRLRRVAELVEARLAEGLSVARLAVAAGLDQARFEREFQRATGLSARQFLFRRRVEFARRIIKDGDRDLASVASRAGFAGRSHLAAALRRHVGAAAAQAQRRGRRSAGPGRGSPAPEAPARDRCR